MNPSDTITIYHVWHQGLWLPVCFMDKEAEVLWVRLMQKIMMEKRFPTIKDYSDFIEEYTPEYFQPK